MSERELYGEEPAGAPEEFPQGLRYTAFVLRLVWVVVVVPLVTGAVLAFVLNVSERSPTPAASPMGAERTSPTIPSEKTTPRTTLEITNSTNATATATSTVSP